MLNVQTEASSFGVNVSAVRNRVQIRVKREETGGHLERGTGVKVQIPVERNWIIEKGEVIEHIVRTKILPQQ